MRKIFFAATFVLMVVSIVEAKVTVLEEDMGVSRVARRANIYVSELVAMNPHLEKPMINKGTKIIFVSHDDIADALSFCKRELWLMDKGRKSAFSREKIESAQEALSVHHVIIKYSPEKAGDGIYFNDILRYADAYKKKRIPVRMN